MAISEEQQAAEAARNAAAKTKRLARELRRAQGRWNSASEAKKDRWFLKVMGSPATRGGGGRPT